MTLLGTIYEQMAEVKLSKKTAYRLLLRKPGALGIMPGVSACEKLCNRPI